MLWSGRCFRGPSWNAGGDTAVDMGELSLGRVRGDERNSHNIQVEDTSSYQILFWVHHPIHHRCFCVKLDIDNV